MESYKPIKKVDKVWGNELWIVNNDNYCSKILTLNYNFRCSNHYHIEKTETFFMLKGYCLLEFYDLENNFLNKIILEQGKSINIRPYEVHSFIGISKDPVEILEISTHHEDYDSYRLSKSRQTNL